MSSKTTIKERRASALAALTVELTEKYNQSDLMETDDDYQLEISISAKEARDIIQLFACEVGCPSHVALTLVAIGRGEVSQSRHMTELRKKANHIVDKKRGI